jgi:hypothetical protein
VSVGLTAALVLTGPTQASPADVSRPAAAAADGAGRGVFQVICRLSHTAPDDPIVAPRDPGGAHLHEFFGNVSTNAYTTTRKLRRGGTTCAQHGDKAAYWVPALYNAGRRVQPNLMITYYRTGQLLDPSVIRPFPRGLRMIAGDGHASRPQSTRVTDWGCDGDGPIGSSEPPRSCPDSPLRLRVIFPNCWDGKRLDSTDHKRHMAYSYRHKRQCPRSHPVALPTLKVHVRYDVRGPLDGLTFSSGSSATAHADFWNAWHRPSLRTLIRRCLLRFRSCDSPPLPPMG